MLKHKTPADWHNAQIVARVRMAGTTLRQLSLAAGLQENSLYQALQRPWPKAERIIADAIGIPPHEIWPSRYDASGEPLRNRTRAAS